jgi:hypothetical protein
MAPIDWAAVKADHEKNQKIRWSKCPPLKKEFYVEHPGQFWGPMLQIFLQRLEFFAKMLMISTLKVDFQNRPFCFAVVVCILVSLRSGGYRL